MRAILYPLLLLVPFMTSCATGLNSGATPEIQKHDPDAAFAQDFAAFTKELEVATPTLTGLSAVVVRENGVIAATNFGMADVENNVAASPQTRWYIASSTKAFVGAAIARLAERGKIDLNWTLAELAPDIKFNPELRANELTLRHMLSHTHGLSSGAIEFRLAYSGQHDPKTLWDLLGKLERNEKAPLGTFEYSNLGYNVATLLIERRLNARWQSIVDKEVTRPLGMRATLTQGLKRARRTGAFAAPYFGNASEARERLYLVKHDDTMQSAGGMYSSTSDMARWLRAQLAAANGHSNDELSQAIRETQNGFAKLESRFGPFERRGYGLGWYSGEYSGSMLHHAFGAFAGAMAHASFVPDANIAVVAMTNEGGAGAMAPHILAAYAYDYFILGAGHAQTKGRERLAEVAKNLATERTRSIASQHSRAERVWALSLPFDAYAGAFCNPALGTIQLSAGDDGLEFVMGRLSARAELFTSPNTFRIEAIPGSGTVGRFVVEGGAVTVLELFDEKFRRCA